MDNLHQCTCTMQHFCYFGWHVKTFVQQALSSYCKVHIEDDLLQMNAWMWHEHEHGMCNYSLIYKKLLEMWLTLMDSAPFHAGELKALLAFTFASAGAAPSWYWAAGHQYCSAP